MKYDIKITLKSGNAIAFTRNTTFTTITAAWQWLEHNFEHCHTIFNVERFACES